MTAARAEQRKKVAAITGEKKRARDVYEGELARAKVDNELLRDMYEIEKAKLAEADVENRRLTHEMKKPRGDRPKICPLQLADSMYFGSGCRTPSMVLKC